MKDGIAWEVRNDRLHFIRERKEMTEIPTNKMINLTLQYATELNKIIWYGILHIIKFIKS